MAAEKTTRSRSTSKKGTSKKSTTKQSTSKKSAPGQGASKKGASKGSSSATSSSRRASAPRAEARPRRPALAVAQGAVEQLSELLGKPVEGVTGIERTDEGWTVELEVLELRRIPSTTDVLASYSVTVSENGDLEGYRRWHRYSRGSTSEDRG